MMRCLIVVILIYLTSCGYRDSEQHNGDVLDDALLDFTYTIHHTRMQSFFTLSEEIGRRVSGALYPDGITYPMIITTRLELDEYLNIYEEAFDELDRINRGHSRPVEYHEFLEKFDEDFFRDNYLVLVYFVIEGYPRLSIDSINDNGDILIIVPHQGIIVASTLFAHFVIELSNDNILEQVNVDFKYIMPD